MQSEFPPHLPSTAAMTLKNAGYFTLDQLTKVTEEELLELHGFGPRAMSILKEFMKEKGLTLKSKK